MMNQDLRKIIYGDDSNRVTVRVWNLAKVRAFGIRVGHISVQTYTGGPEGKGVYASLWPAEGSAFQQLDGVVAKHNSLEDDIIAEQSPPSKTINFYTLNPVDISRKYIDIVGINPKWSATAGLRVTDDAIVQYANNKQEVIRLHCAALALGLLKAGGIIDKFKPIPEFFPEDLNFEKCIWLYMREKILNNSKAEYISSTNKRGNYEDMIIRELLVMYPRKKILNDIDAFFRFGWATAQDPIFRGINKIKTLVEVEMTREEKFAAIRRSLILPGILGEWCELHQTIERNQNLIILKEPAPIIDIDPVEHDRQIHEKLKKQHPHLFLESSHSKCIIL